MQKKFTTVDGETLMSQSLMPIKFVVANLIPQGLHILSGAPKIGKSWLVLWLSLQVAKGESAWGFSTTQGTTLYLCLEDSISRIQNRLFNITDDAPPNIHFSTIAENIGSGIEQQIENFVTKHADTKLIVIDTFQKIRNISNDNAYASDYRDISLLKNVADKFGIAILLIHHLRKQKDDDPMNMVSGTTGITGAVDSSYVLTKSKRNSDKAVLYCTGRDIEYRELELSLNNESHLWDLLSDSVENPEILLEKIIFLVAEFIRENIFWSGTPSELATALQPQSEEKIIPNILSKKLLQNKIELEELGICYSTKRSNGRRLIELKISADSADSADKYYMPNADPVDPDHNFEEND